MNNYVVTVRDGEFGTRDIKVIAENKDVAEFLALTPEPTNLLNVSQVISWKRYLESDEEVGVK